MSKKTLLIIIFMFCVILLSACGGTTTPTPETIIPNYSILGTKGQMSFVLIDKDTGSDSSGLRRIAEKICKNQTICIVSFWDDKSKAASSIPMTDEQVNSRVAAYNLNKNTDLDRLLICAIDGC